MSMFSELIAEAEHLLWVVARSDVEGLSAPRTHILRRLEILERQAREIGLTDLYSRVLQQSASPTKIVI